MRNIWKVALAFTVALGLGALAQAQLIVGNTAAFGCGPIMTSDFSLGAVTHQFVPDGAIGAATCPHDGAPPFLNGRGMALGGGGGIFRLFYTELDEIPGVGGQSGFGPSEFIHVADFNNGDGSGDIALFPNPRPGSGIQDLTIANGDLYVLTGYDTQVPQVFVLNTFTGALKRGPIPIQRVGDVDDTVDGFAVLPNGNFLLNNKGTSCIYAEYDKTDGHFIGNIINVPGGPALCTGVDTDGTSLYFVTEPSLSLGITRTDLFGNPTGFNSFNGPGAEDLIEDISLVHPITVITGIDPAHLWIGLRNSDDINTRFDLMAEMLLNGTPITSGLVRCIQNVIRDPKKAVEVVIPFGAFGSVPLVSGDVLAVRVSTRVGTLSDDSFCGGHNGTVGLRLYYDSVGYSSHVDATIAPQPTQSLYLHSNGNPCDDAGFDSSGVTSRSLSNVPPIAAFASKKCKDALAFKFAGGNPFTVIGTLPVPAGTWSLPPQ
jgi:hypothetical protein